MRVIVIGNSGSGKSTLAASLALEHVLVHKDLDTMAWEPTEPPKRVPLGVAAAELRDFAARNSRWVVEGCYADLARLLLAEATLLIFTDIPVERCQQHARLRPWEPHKYDSKQAQDANLPMLLAWIAEYPERQGPLGRSEHLALFDAFAGEKQRRR